MGARSQYPCQGGHWVQVCSKPNHSLPREMNGIERTPAELSWVKFDSCDLRCNVLSVLSWNLMHQSKAK